MKKDVSLVYGNVTIVKTAALAKLWMRNTFQKISKLVDTLPFCLQANKKVKL